MKRSSYTHRERKRDASHQLAETDICSKLDVTKPMATGYDHANMKFASKKIQGMKQHNPWKQALHWESVPTLIILWVDASSFTSASFGLVQALPGHAIT